jgi:uncharacterized protein
MNNGRMNGGMMEMTPDMQFPPNWTVYFTVKDIKDAVAKVKKLDGKVYMQKDLDEVGKIAMIADPTGASFMIIEMSVPPQEWEE